MFTDTHCTSILKNSPNSLTLLTMNALRLPLIAIGLLFLVPCSSAYAKPSEPVDPVGTYKSVEPEGLYLSIMDGGLMVVAYEGRPRVPTDMPLSGDWKLQGNDLRVKPRDIAETMLAEIEQPRPLPKMKPSVWKYAEDADGTPTYTFRSSRALSSIVFRLESRPSTRMAKPNPNCWIEVDGKRLHLLKTEENEIASSKVYVPENEENAPYSRLLRVSVLKSKDITPEAYAKGQQQLNDNQAPDKLGEVRYDEGSERWAFTHIYTYLQDAPVTVTHAADKGVVWSCYLAETGPDGLTVAHDYFIHEPIRGTASQSLKRMLKLKEKVMPRLLKEQFKVMNKAAPNESASKPGEAQSE